MILKYLIGDFIRSLGEHFYEFTCGTYIKNKRVPDEQSKIDIFDDLRDNLAYNIAGFDLLWLFFILIFQ